MYNQWYYAYNNLHNIFFSSKFSNFLQQLLVNIICIYIVLLCTSPLLKYGHIIMMALNKPISWI